MGMTRVLLCLLVVVCAASRATAQTLAEVARAEQERRKAVGAAAKVYTNGSLKAEPLPSVPLPSAPLPSAPAMPADTAVGAGPAVSVPPGAPANVPDGVPDGAGPTPSATALPLPATEEGWRTRVKGLTEGLARNQVVAEALQSRVDALLTDFVNRDDPAQRAVVEVNRVKALAELDRVRTDIKAGQKAVVDLEEQARRAGVPPGWLR